MSLSRTALRLAVIEALAPHAQNSAETPVWPTFAGRQVFDSQISPVGLSSLDPELPAIVVSVDSTKTETIGGAPDATIQGDGKELATLAFEIMVPVVTRGENGDAVSLVGPTDAMAKATIEMVEDQIHQRIADARMSGPLRHVLFAIQEFDSQPYSDPDTDVLLSAVRLEMKCHVAERERWPAPATTGLASLPNPLRAVALELPAGSYGATVAAGLAQLLGEPAVFPALSALRLAANLTRAGGETPPDETNASLTPPAGDVGGSVAF